ncbi:DUF4082 domain-containing protein [Pedobacter aquatilis]|uniref:DUF4082 domain-containing protein n=1 Tax=Pedobacter aquatilis TaxID=351343 RepID=UPI0025B3481B|nr:DUF4082 domain-containing protein [Pedobacter aquatilis]MDN3588952.1 DUF4082 domain-containing protein [Pedobacter aquatilis]
MMNRLFLLLMIALSSCTVLKNGTSYLGEDRIFGKHFNRTFKTEYKEVDYRASAVELGIAIKPHKDGRIKGIRIKNPTKGYVRLSIWDADTRELIQSTNVNISDTVDYNFFYIQMPLIANKTYTISINVLKYYYYKLPFNPLPLHSNDVSLLYSVYEETPYQRFPGQNVASVYHGIIDIDAEFKID